VAKTAPRPVPGLYEDPAPAPPRETPVRDDIAAFVGLTRRGPVDRALRLERWEDYLVHFGGRDAALATADAVLGFFLNGGSTCYVVRVLHRAAGPAGEEIGVAATEACVELTIGASSDHPRWSAAQGGVADPGLWAEHMAIALRLGARELELAATPVAPDGQTLLVVGGPGRGRVGAGDTLWIREGAGSRFAVVAELGRASSSPGDDDFGPQLGLRLRAPLSPPLAAGARVALLEPTVDVAAPDGTRERHERLGLDPLHPRYLPGVLARESRLVALLDAQGGWLVDTLVPVQLRTGDAGAVPLAGPQVAELKGGKDGIDTFVRADYFAGAPDAEQPESLLGVDQLRVLDDVSLVVLPDLVLPAEVAEAPAPRDLPEPPRRRARFRCGEPARVEPLPPPALPEIRRPLGLLDPAVAPVEPPRTRADLWRDLTTAEARLVSYCAESGDRVALLAPPPSATPTQVVAWRRRIDSAFAAAYYPWIDFGDPITDPPLRRVPPTGVAAGLIARAEHAFGVGRAPANLLTLAVNALTPKVSDDEWAMLHEADLDVLVRTPAGIRLMGARTLASDYDFRYLHVRRLLTHIERILRRRMTWAVFEPNTPGLWERITSDLEANVLRPLFERGAFAGDTPETSYFVRCDATLNPIYERDLGRLVCEIGVAPSVPAEYIVFRLAAGRELGVEISERF
jgi:hypothetical protein